MRLFYFLPLFLTISCSNFFYYPDKYLYSDPHKLGYSFTNVKIPSSDNVTLHAWHFKNISKNKTKGLVLFLHGNAQNISSHYQSIAWMTKYGFEVVAVDYRGYGLSTGSPNQKGVYLDALEALKYSYQHFKSKKMQHFIVYGQSLGGNIGLRAIEDFKNIDDISLLVLDSTFISYKELAFDKLKSIWITWPFSPLAWVLFSDEYSPKHFVRRNPVTTLVIHGEDDQVVPFSFGEDIYKKTPLGKKSFWTIKNGKHTDVFFRDDINYKSKFIHFIQNLNDTKKGDHRSL